MSEQGGGGASLTTDPAAGSSAATDVSLREVFQLLRTADRTRANERLAWMLSTAGVIWFFIERHLSNLNHENARIADVAKNTVSADTYAANEQQRRSEQQKLDDRLAGYDKNFTQSVTREDLTRETKGDHQTSAGLWISAAAIIVAIVVATVTVVMTRGASPSAPTSAVTCTASYHPAPCPQP